MYRSLKTFKEGLGIRALIQERAMNIYQAPVRHQNLLGTYKDSLDTTGNIGDGQELKDIKGAFMRKGASVGMSQKHIASAKKTLTSLRDINGILWDTQGLYRSLRALKKDMGIKVIAYGCAISKYQDPKMRQRLLGIFEDIRDTWELYRSIECQKDV